MSDGSAKETIDASLTALGVERTRLARRNPKSTLEAREEEADPGHERAVKLLSDIDSGRAERLVFGKTLGEGGMGIVQLATQVSLGREVAVKALRAEHQGAEASRRLLREAWTTGAVEHPNIVPVYDISLDERGNPRVVLKRIEGTDWSSLLADPAALAKLADTDVEEWNIRVLMQVCNAVHFAHQRGILHRDLKPENVMIGRFGEVFVVDWGIAVSIREDADPRIPRAREATDVAGTPAYMAPEMLSGDPERLGVHTDVYLLGGILHEILTGRPPHDGLDLESILESIMRPVARLGARVPRDLAVICERALSLNPKDRPESAEAFRMLLAGYLLHRDSMRLGYRAQRRLTELMDELSTEDAGSETVVQHLFGQCRFGFLAALEQWPENEAASGGLRVAVTAMARHALDRRQLDAAKVHLAELNPPPADLVARAAALEAHAAADAERRKELETFERQHDRTTGSRTRFLVVGSIGILLTMMPLAHHMMSKTHSLPANPEMALLSSAGILPVVLGLGFWARSTLMKTLFNLRLYAIIVFTVLSFMVLMFGAMHTGVSASILFPATFFVWFTISAMTCITLEWRFWPTTAGYLLGAAWLVSSPDAPLLAMSLTNAVLTANIAFLWAPMVRRSGSTAR